MAEQIAFDVEKYRPQCRVRAISNQVASVEHEVGHSVFQHRADHTAVHVVPGAGVAIYDKLEVRSSARSRRERTAAVVKPFDVIVVLGAWLKPRIGDLLGAKHRSRLLNFARFGAESGFAGPDNPDQSR